MAPKDKNNGEITSNIQYIQRDISDIKADLRSLKGDFATKEELNGSIQRLEQRIDPLQKFIYGIISVVGVSIIITGLALINIHK